MLLSESLHSSQEKSEPADDWSQDCPVCQSDGLGVLAKRVPRRHNANSMLICRITGKIMDDKNPPLCLPNGRVYSQEVRLTCYTAHTQALERMAKSSADGVTVTCPRTNSTFPYAACRKMYIS